MCPLHNAQSGGLGYTQITYAHTYNNAAVPYLPYAYQKGVAAVSH